MKKNTTKTEFKPGNMLYPLPAVLVSCGGGDLPDNLFTVAWAGTICTNPPMVSISVRPERYSYSLIRESGEFVINLTTKELVFATDYCGVRSGRDGDKWNACHLTKLPAREVSCPMVGESPVNIECRVCEVKELGSHSLFLAKVIVVHADSRFFDEKNTFHLNDSHLLTYSHGSYFSLGEKLGTFGYSVAKKKKKNKRRAQNENLLSKNQKLQIHPRTGNQRDRKRSHSGGKK